MACTVLGARLLTMYLMGRQAVLEALRSARIGVDRVLIATTARGDGVDDVETLAGNTQVPLERVSEKRLDQLAGGDRMHQGVLAQVVPPEPLSIDAFVAGREGRNWATDVLVLDHVHNPANVGMILRTAAGAGIDGVVLPEQGTASIGPVTVKAGSGMVFAVPLITAQSTGEALNELIVNGFAVAGLDAQGESLFDAELPDRCAYVLGNETVGLSSEAEQAVQMTLALPLSNGVESLNVAAAGAILSYELVRRRSTR